MQNYEIQSDDWARLAADAKPIREQVFIQEQHISPEDEWDADDATALHAVLFDREGRPLGNARLLQPSPSMAKVGRMAVLKDVRGQGIGSRLLKALLRCAQERDHQEVRLSAQKSAEKFYAAHGFCPIGAPFDEVGIPHIEMKLDLV